jgi:hypothetical protein
MPGPTGFALERFVRPRESARGRTHRASATAQLAVRARAARPYAKITGPRNAGPVDLLVKRFF